jgi:hypothetical protein
MCASRGVAEHRPDPLTALSRLLLPALLGALLLLVALQPVYVVDLWWQMATGRVILATGAVPHADIFSFTAPGAPWTVHEWVPDLLFYLAYTGGHGWAPQPLGGMLLVAFKMGMVAAAFLLLYVRSLKVTGRPALSTVVTLAGVGAASPFFDIRPQLLTYLLLGVTLLAAEAWIATGHRRALVALPLIFLIWSNVHAGFGFGLAALAAVALGEAVDAALGRSGAAGAGAGDQPQPRRWSRLRAAVRAAGPLGAAVAASAAAACANPNGPRLFLYPFTIFRHPSVQSSIIEWFSPNFHDSQWTGFEIYLGLAAAAWAVGGRRARCSELLLLIGSGHLALFSVRHIPLMVIATAPAIAACLSGVVRAVEKRGSPARARRLALAGALGLGACMTLAIGACSRALAPPSTLFARTARMDTFPAAACDFILRSGMRGRLFNDYKWGGFCIWSLWPRWRVFIDGRAEVYFGGEQSPYEDYFAIHNVRSDWEAVLDRREVDIALLDANSYAERVMRLAPQWQLVYTDDVARVYARRRPFWQQPDSLWLRDQRLPAPGRRANGPARKTRGA